MAKPKTSTKPKAPTVKQVTNPTCKVSQAHLRQFSDDNTGEIEITVAYADRVGIPKRFRL